MMKDKRWEEKDYCRDVDDDDKNCHRCTSTTRPGTKKKSARSNNVDGTNIDGNHRYRQRYRQRSRLHYAEKRGAATTMSSKRKKGQTTKDRVTMTTKSIGVFTDVCAVITGKTRLSFTRNVSNRRDIYQRLHFGILQWSKEPIAMVTREGNNAKLFFNSCYWIVQSLTSPSMH